MSIYTQKEYDYEDDLDFVARGKKPRKIANDSSKHYPNKNESRELRKIMAETGLSEAEVRADKKYRKQLSDAQKAGLKPKRSEAELWYHHCIKEACRKTGLAKEHPETLMELQAVLDERYNGWRRPKFTTEKLSATAVIKNYGKTYR